MQSIHLASLDRRRSVLALIRRTLGDRLRLLTRCRALELLADGLDGRRARAADGSGVTEVGVDTGEDLAAVGLDAADVDAAGDRVLAVAAGAVELAEVHDGWEGGVSGFGAGEERERELTEAADGDGSFAVVLDDFAGGMLELL